MFSLKKEPFVLKSNSFLTLEPFREVENRLIVGFSTRKNGFSINPYTSLNVGLHVDDDQSKVIANRKKIAHDLQIPLNRWVFSEQIHSNRIEKITEKDCGSGTLSLDNAIKATDGMYTKESNILLASLYADCVPLYFFSSTKQIVGVAHAGWKGTIQLIGPKMIEIWTKDEKVPLHSIYAAIGPSISQGCYEVDDHVINKVKDVIQGNYELLFTKNSDNKYLLNLKQLNKQLLINAGLKEEQIFTSDYCTYKENDLFFSYRRQNKTGRMMSFIAKNKGG